MLRFHRSVRIAMILALLLGAAPALAQGTLFVENDFVGIGNANPTRPLHIITASAPANTVVEVQNHGPARIRFRNSTTNETWNFGHQAPSGTGLVFSDVGDAFSEMLLDVDGNLTITGDLTTAGGNYPDYVFEPGYDLMPLSDLRSYIGENGHLPGVPSAGDVTEQGGVNMSRLQLTLLEKVEELTLYTLEQDRLITEQTALLQELAARAEAQDALISDLRARLDETE